MPTLNGPVTLKVPAGTPNGKTFRVRGKGAPKKGGNGDILVTVSVDVPDKLSRGREAVAQAAAGSPEGFPTEAIGGGLMVDREDRDVAGAERPVYMISVARSSPACIRRPSGSTSGRDWCDPSVRRATRAGTRDADVELLRWIQALTQDEGINLAGVKRIMEMRAADG